MDATAMKHMALNFVKLDKFEGVDFRIRQKKMHFLLSGMSVMYVLTTPILEDDENATMEQIRKRNKWENDDYFVENDFKHTLKHKKEELTYVELGIHLRIEESLKVYTNNKGKRKHHDNIRADPNKKAKPTCWKCGKTGHIKRDCKGVNAGSKTNSSDTSGSWNSLVPLKGEAIKSQDVAFWKEAINDEMYSIMGYNTWVLADLPLGCKPLGCKWIFKRKLKVDGTIENFKAKLVIQGFKRKSKIDYFDTYALVARIIIIRLLIAMSSIHNLIIHQMDVKKNFLNGELEEEVYMNQPQGFIMSGNENKVDLTKEFLSSRFSMKDKGEADVILGIRIKHESNGITISQSHYIEKVLKKFNYFYCTPVSTSMDTSEKLMPNNGHVVSQLEFSR
ncbi:zinc finger, CCHC-type containing protein, partial [Tanacetum coccineum]